MHSLRHKHPQTQWDQVNIFRTAPCVSVRVGDVFQMYTHASASGNWDLTLFVSVCTHKKQALMFGQVDASYSTLSDWFHIVMLNDPVWCSLKQWPRYHHAQGRERNRGGRRLARRKAWIRWKKEDVNTGTKELGGLKREESREKESWRRMFIWINVIVCNL